MTKQTSVNPEATKQIRAYDSLKELRRIDPISNVRRERVKQDAKWGQQNHDDYKWLAILAEEFGEVGKAVCEQISGRIPKICLKENLEIELIQVAAVCISWIECLRRNEPI